MPVLSIAQATPPLIPGDWLIAVAIAVLTTIGGSAAAVITAYKRGQASSVTIAGQPVEIAMRERYATRTDCIQCKSDMRDDVREMKVMYDKAITLIQERDDRLSHRLAELGEQLHARITQQTDEAAERRRRIHDKLNEHADQLSRIDSRTEVSKSIGRLGAAVMALANKKGTPA